MEHKRVIMEELFGKKWTTLDFIKFVTPSVLSIISISLYMVVDAIFISRFVGSYAMASVNIIMPLFSFCFGIGIMVAAGASAIIGIELGEDRHGLANAHFSLSFWFLVLVMAGIFIVSELVGMERISDLLGATEKLMPFCVDYLGVFIFGIAALVLQIFFEFFIRLDGKPVWAFYTTIAGGLTNVILDYVLILRLDMGIRGAGIASAAGIWAAVMTGVFYFIYKSENLKFSAPVRDFRFLADSMINGSSEMVSEISSGVKTLVFNLVIITYAGEDGVAAMSILMYLFFLLSSLFIGLSMGVSPVISYNYGARRFEKIRELVSHSCRITFVTSVMAFLVAMFWGGTAIDIFAKGQGRVVAIAENGMHVFAFTFLINGINILASAFFTSVNNGKISAIISFLKSFVFTLGFIVLLPPYMGLEGVWLSVPLAEIATLIFSVYYVMKYRGRYLCPAMVSRAEMGVRVQL